MTPSDDEGLREEIRNDLAKLFDAGVHLKSRAGGTAESEFAYKKYSVDEVMALISQKIKEAYTAGANSAKGTFEQVALEARIDELERIATFHGHYKRSMLIDERLASLTTKQDTKEKV
ncbi:hypothetical protein AB4Y95_00385 [Arthrobacter sp. M-10]|uniref:hypothetical protein n=1 Tax=Arthrobacter sp. M-10 TaxID=3233037 RepID=UPI003F8F2D83